MVLVGMFLLATNLPCQPLMDQIQCSFQTTHSTLKHTIVSQDISLTIIIEMCKDKYGLVPRYNWVWEMFGGQNIQTDF